MKYHVIAQAILFSTTLTIVAMPALAQNVADVPNVPDASEASNAIYASNASTDVEVINVFGDYSQLSLDQIAQSATIISAEAVQQRHVNHIDGLLNIAPNVNFTSGASRGKYIQIRGIGERSQFGEPLNPSVGLVLDGMDVSGLGGIATLLDVAQVEILRGPQATVFGTSGLAGVVNIVSNGPTDTPSGTFSVKAATQNTFAVNGAYGLRLDNGLGLRAAVAKNTSDGFVKNAHLGRDDTSNIDETSLRLRGDLALTDTLTLDAQVLHVNAQNGYDAFSLDNDNVTLSDEPGVDNTEATVMGFGLTQVTNWGQWRVQGSATRSDSTYGYDEDWTFVGFHPWEYSSTDYYLRERDTDTLEFQARSSDSSAASIQWVGGVLHKQSTDHLVRQYTYADTDFASQYDPTSTAIYGQVTLPLAALPGVSMEAGLRVEQHDIDYMDNTGFAQVNDETLVGGKVALSYRQAANTLYGFVARGYKAGGFNADERVPDAQRIYEAEYNWHYELGVKSRFADNDASLRLALFYMTRENTHISDFATFAQDSGAVEFIDIVDNADTGINQGVEAEFAWQLSDHVDVGVNLGYLDATFKGFTRSDGVVVDKQRQAQAPRFSGQAFVNTALTEDILWHVSLEAKSSHRFSDGHDEINPGFGLVNTSVTMPLTGGFDGWTVSAFVNNVTDKAYFVRGFGGFSNDPRDYYETPEPYVQFGYGRQSGVQVSYAF